MSTRVCALADVLPGAGLRVELADTDVAVVRVGDEVFALEDVCSHAEFPLTDGDVDGFTIECALHGSRFDLRSGKPLGPPATQPVQTYPVTVTDGDVYIDMENNQ
jgi:3-phenylpropionate/trans-cinnamate dioxygenase ferredoxin subunit